MKLTTAVVISACVLIAGLTPTVAQKPATPPPAAATPEVMSIDVKDTDIRDVIRMISTGYNLNIIMDKEVSGKVTLHLSNVPIMEGMQTLAQSQGLEVIKEGSVYRIKQAAEKAKSVISFVGGKLSVDVENLDVRDFLQELSSKAAVSIVPDNKVQGTITGKLYRVDLGDGIRAILEGNGFTVIKQRNIYQVSPRSEGADAGGGGGPSPFRARPRANSASFYVDYKDGKLSINVVNQDLGEIVKAIAEQSDAQIITYGALRGDVNAKLDEVPLEQALALLLGGTDFTFIQRNGIILIGNRNPATPSGEALSTSELVHLKHIKAEAVMPILPKGIEPSNIKVVKEQNALLVSGTSEDIVNTKSFLDAIDIRTPQVIIDVLVVEYSRDVNRELGLELGTAAGAKTQFSYPYLSAQGNKTYTKMMMEGLGVTGNVVQLLDDFYFKLSLLERQSKARVLAQPSITVLNGNKATIDVGQSQFFKITSGTSDNPTYQFRPISFGITLNITPWISQSGQITADISPEISNSVGTNADNYPNIFKRSVSTTVRLDNKQTLVLGGLLSSQDNTADQRVPFFGDIPIIGNLFKTINKSHTQTNLVIYITPRIVEQASVDLAGELQRFESNQKSRVRADEPIMETLKRSSTSGGMGRRDTTAIKAPRDTTTADAASDSLEIVPALPTAKTISDTTSGSIPAKKDR